LIGTNLKILKYPHPLLRTENTIITTFDDNLKTIAHEMLLIMYAAEGVGLAAPQVGINKRLMVFNEEGDKIQKEKEGILDYFHLSIF
jgi:peptide deformylase